MRRGVTVLLAIVVVVVVAAFFARQRLLLFVAVPSVAVDRPNVLLITLDTFRADRLGRGLTPNLDKLAARGARFTNVRATAPLTLPSHASIMTGLTPPLHGVRENGVVFDRKTPTLARLLRDNGYATAAFVGAYVLNRRFGLDEGFEVYDDAVRRDPVRSEQLEAERPGSEVVDVALAWLADGSRGKPFLMWVHLYDPHAPYSPPKEFLEKAHGNAYDGEIAYADAQVGRLLDAIEARGLAASTVVAVTGDHGESLGEHGESTHGMLAYDATLRVPLIVSAPGVDAGTRETPLSLTELAGALLRATGAAMPSGPMCHGALFHRPGAGNKASEPCDVYSESRYPRRAGWHAITALSDSQWKVIATSERELFDVRTDPNERKNVAASHGNIVQAMSKRLAALATAGGAEASQVAPDAAERLRALGYASGSNAIRSDDPGAPNPASVIDAWVRFERALGDVQAGRAVTALPSLKALVTQHPGAPVFQSTYAQALKDAGRGREAVAVYKAAVAKWPNDATLFHDLAVAAREAGDAAEAARAEQAAIALDGTSAMAQNGLGLLHADAGRAADAAAAFEKAVDQDPTSASYWTNLGNARRALNDSPRAERAYRNALGLDDGFADALNGLGTLLVQSGRASEGVPLFERALRRDPDLHEARLNLGIAYQESGQREKAAATYREILKKTPPRFARERAAAGELLQSIK